MLTFVEEQKTKWTDNRILFCKDKNHEYLVNNPMPFMWNRPEQGYYIKEASIFFADLHILGHRTKTIILRDSRTGIEVDMFTGDFCDASKHLLDGGHMIGFFEFTKRGNTYGVRYIMDIEEQVRLQLEYNRRPYKKFLTINVL